MKSFLKWKHNTHEYYYHASYGVYKNSIAKHGLKCNPSKRNWTDSAKGVVYLSKNPDVALSYAETSEEAPDSYLDHIVVYKILRKNLDLRLLRKDRNVRSGETGEGDTVEYAADVPARYLKIYKEYK